MARPGIPLLVGKLEQGETLTKAEHENLAAANNEMLAKLKKRSTNDLSSLDPGELVLYAYQSKNSPFKGLIPYIPSKQDISSGAQVKAAGSGKYLDVNTGEYFFIKKSENRPQDDIAEIYSSLMAREINGEHIAKCTFIKNNKNKETFVKSKMYDGFKPLYQHKRGINLGFTRLGGFKHGSDFPLARNKNHPIKVAIDKMTGENAHQKAELAQVLATSFLMRGYDVQTENINYYTGDDGKTHIGRIDFGWMLNGIVSEKTVKLRTSMVMNITKGMPTNHYNDFFPFIKNELEAAFETAAVQCKNQLTQMQKVMDESIQALGECAKDGETHIAQAKALYHLAQHMGIKSWSNDQRLNQLFPLNGELGAISEKESKLVLSAMKKIVHKELSNSLTSRANQMSCIAKYIKHENTFATLNKIKNTKKRRAAKQDASIALLASLNGSKEFTDPINGGSKHVNMHKGKTKDYPNAVLNKRFINKILSRPMTEAQKKIVVQFVNDNCKMNENEADYSGPNMR